jgi:hypothetical protein
MYARYFSTVPSHQKSREAGVSLSNWIRQTHRWLGIIFTLTVIANFAVRAFQEPPAWITYSPLPPLFLQMFGGLYLFFRPGRRQAGTLEVDAR